MLKFEILPQSLIFVFEIDTLSPTSWIFPLHSFESNAQVFVLLFDIFKFNSIFNK